MSGWIIENDEYEIEKFSDSIFVMSNLEIIILAAGKGTRMGGDKPKVLVDVAGRPMLSYILDAVAGAHTREPLVVIGFQAEKVKETIGQNRRYVLQEKQQGTGHAVGQAIPHLLPGTQHVIVLNGDQPLVNSASVQTLFQAHLDKNKSGKKTPLTIGTIRLPDFGDWRQTFFDFGRIVRNKKGEIEKIVEKSDATDVEKTITEVNPAYYCFDADWLRDRVSQLDTSNPQGEYYITDLIEIAQHEGAILNSVEIPAHQALGVNTPEQLAMVLEFMKNPNKK